MYYVYVLRSKRDSRFYIGYSSDLKSRIERHRAGYVPATKDRRPLELLYYEAHTSRADAIGREKYFKTSKGKTSLRRMLADALTQNLRSVKK